MRYLNVFLALLMLLFIVVQYNDPDGPLWMAIYLVPTTWALLAAYNSSWLRRSLPTVLLSLSIVLSLGLMAYFWPKTPGWWQQDIWWEVESAREGMGMMIVTFVLLVVWLSRWRSPTISEP